MHDIQTFQKLKISLIFQGTKYQEKMSHVRNTKNSTPVTVTQEISVSIFLQKHIQQKFTIAKKLNKMLNKINT